MYKIGNFIFEISGIDDNQMPDNFLKFKTEQKATYFYHINFVEMIKIRHKQLTVDKQTIKINIDDNGLETRYLSFPGDNNIYAMCEEIDENHSEISIYEQFIDYLKIDTCFSSLFSLERRMNNYHSYVLHSSYIVYNNEAILFSAPSGTGKSTQADLWKKYKNINIINGDRTLLSKHEGQYFANGWPVCGSSEICHNQTYPLKAIVMLDQGLNNIIDEPSYITKTKRLMKEITINYYNQQYLDNALSFIDDLINSITIVHLSCTIDKEAVDILYDYLYR